MPVPGREGLHPTGNRRRHGAMRAISIVISSSLAAVVMAWAAADGSGRRELLGGEPIVADLDRARALLGTWEQTEPERGERVMRVVYWTPADREPQPAYRERLTRVMRHIQAFYAREMAAWGFGERTIRLEVEADGLLRLPVAKGRLKSAECSEADRADGQEIRRDCVRVLRESGVDADSETMVIFCNLADWDPDKRTMSHHSPYYAGGDSRGGTAWQVDSPLLDAALLGEKGERLTDRQYGFISVGRYNSIFVGGVCHELGHALGLPHCRESAASHEARGTALMGSGNRTYGEDLRGEGRGSFLTLAHALKLAAHPQFSGSVKGLRTSLEATFDEWEFLSGADGLKASGRVKTNLPCHAVLAYGDPEGGGDYDAAIAAAVPGADGRFTLLLPPAQAKGKAALLSFVAVAVNGAATAGVSSRQAFSLACRIDRDGRYDVSGATGVMQALAHAAAARKGRLPDNVRSGLSLAVQEALRRLGQPDNFEGLPSPAAAATTVKELPLSDAAPAAARTGWGGVHRDRSDEGQPLVGPDGVAAHGLWAHADAEHEYELGGSWNELSGRCGLLQSGDGPVTAEILGDGRRLWASPEIREGKTQAFKVDVSGVQRLVLKVKGVGGIRAAHAAWLEPVLRRAP